MNRKSLQQDKTYAELVGEAIKEVEDIIKNEYDIKKTLTDFPGEVKNIIDRFNKYNLLNGVDDTKNSIANISSVLLSAGKTENEVYEMLNEFKWCIETDYINNHYD